MNNKGFTLIELLAVIVLIALVMGIASYGVFGVINKSKTRSEKIFVDKLGSVIDEYIALEGSNLDVVVTGLQIANCDDRDCSSRTDVEAMELSGITIMDLVNRNLIKRDMIVNPGNKKVCFDNVHNPVIRIFRNVDYVYFYYVDLSDNVCSISNENNVINTLPGNELEYYLRGDEGENEEEVEP